MEIVDSETGAPVAEGEAGNICDTVLFKDTIYPIIRFDTFDISAILPGPSALGLPFRRIAGFQGRGDNMVKLRGINVYPTAIGAHLAGHPATTGEFVCKRRWSGGREELAVVIEVRDEARGPALAAELAELLRRNLGVRLAVELAAPGETAALTGIERRQKPIRLIDERT